MIKQLAIVSLLSGLAQLAAFGKLWFITHIFGVSAEVDGYYLALVLPTLISGVTAGAIQTGLFPVRARLHAKGDPSALAAFERMVLAGVGLTGCALMAALLLIAPWLPRLIATSESSTVHTSLLFTLPFAAVLIPLNMVGDCTGYLLAMRDRFWIAAGAPLANGVLGALMLAAWPEGGLLNLAGSTTIGLALQVSICLWGLKTTGFSFTGKLSSWQQTRKQWREMLSLGGWILPGVVFSNLVAALPPLWMAQYGPGFVSAFGYAYRLYNFSLHLLVMAGSTIILARFSELVAREDTAAVNRILRKSAFASAAAGVIGILAVWGFGTFILGKVFGGRFDAVAAERVAAQWFWLTLGLPFAISGNVFAKLLQAQKRPHLLSIMAGIGLASCIFVHSLTTDLLQSCSVSAAISFSSFSVVLSGIWFLRPPKIRRS